MLAQLARRWLAGGSRPTTDSLGFFAIGKMSPAIYLDLKKLRSGATRHAADHSFIERPPAPGKWWQTTGGVTTAICHPGAATAHDERDRTHCCHRALTNSGSSSRASLSIICASIGELSVLSCQHGRNNWPSRSRHWRGQSLRRQHGRDGESVTATACLTDCLYIRRHRVSSAA